MQRTHYWSRITKQDCLLYLDVVDEAALWSDFSSDALEFEAESWSSVVESSFCHKQEKNFIKRQDVIYGKLFCKDSIRKGNTCEHVEIIIIIKQFWLFFLNIFCEIYPTQEIAVYIVICYILIINGRSVGRLLFSSCCPP